MGPAIVCITFVHTLHPFMPFKISFIMDRERNHQSTHTALHTCGVTSNKGSAMSPDWLASTIEFLGMTVAMSETWKCGGELSVTWTGWDSHPERYYLAQNVHLLQRGLDAEHLPHLTISYVHKLCASSFMWE